MQPEQSGVQVRTAWHAVLPFKDCEAVVPTAFVAHSKHVFTLHSCQSGAPELPDVAGETAQEKADNARAMAQAAMADARAKVGHRCNDYLLILVPCRPPESNLRAL